MHGKELFLIMNVPMWWLLGAQINAYGIQVCNEAEMSGNRIFRQIKFALPLFQKRNCEMAA